MKINVKIGSNQVTVNITKETSCLDLIKSTIEQCKIVTTNIKKTYALFEKANGVERLVKQEENIYNLVHQLNGQGDFELIIKKCRKSQVITRSMARNKKYGQKLFKILKEKNLAVLNNIEVPNSDNHEYDVINDEMLHQYQPPKLVKCVDNYDRIFKTDKRLFKTSQRTSRIDNSIVKHLKNVRKIIDELNSKNVECQIKFKKEFFL